MKTTNLFSLAVSRINVSEFEALVCSLLSGSSPKTIAKVNPEYIVRSIRSHEFRDTLEALDYRIADGRGLVWAAYYLSLPKSKNPALAVLQAVYQLAYSLPLIVLAPRSIEKPLPGHIPGIVAFRSMIRAAIKMDESVFFFGSKQQVLKKMLENLKIDYPDLKVAGFLEGYGYQQDSLVDPLKIINKSKAGMLFVALGSPKQEKWILENKEQLTHVRVIVGEGGTYDRVASPSQQAPQWLNRLGLEWVWRSIFNKSLTVGRGRFLRFWNSVPVFIYYTFLEKARG